MSLTILTLASLTAGLYVIILLRYVLVAGAFCIFFPTRRGLPPSAWRDMRLSALSALIFAFAGALALMAKQAGATLLYDEQTAHGWWYIPFSYVLVLLLQDAYFYGTHRLAHRESLYRHVHRGHHRSGRPTPWTSFAFDPAEAVVQAVFLLAIVFFIPLHSVVMIAILATMTVWAVVNHLGIDRLPFGLPQDGIGRWFIGPAHHSVHHDRHNVHFGLYFTFWDKLLGTEDLTYTLRFNPAREL